MPAAVWAVTQADERVLDRYEGCPVFYRKEALPITYTGLKSGLEHQVRAFVYIMKNGRRAGLPAMQYLNTCEEGYCDFGFSPDLLDEARTYTEEVMALERGNR